MGMERATRCATGTRDCRVQARRNGHLGRRCRPPRRCEISGVCLPPCRSPNMVRAGRGARRGGARGPGLVCLWHSCQGAGAATRWTDCTRRGNGQLERRRQPAQLWLGQPGLQDHHPGPSAFQLLNDRNPAHDARATLQMVISHEMGHLFGVVAHSRRCVDVSSYYNNAQGEQCTIRGGQPRPPGVEYRSPLPTACDIQRCKAANP